MRIYSETAAYLISLLASLLCDSNSLFRFTRFSFLLAQFYGYIYIYQLYGESVAQPPCCARRRPAALAAAQLRSPLLAALAAAQLRSPLLAALAAAVLRARCRRPSERPQRGLVVVLGVCAD